MKWTDKKTYEVYYTSFQVGPGYMLIQLGKWVDKF